MQAPDARLYSIRFECLPTNLQGPDQGKYYNSGQIGHCHTSLLLVTPPCGALTTTPDETTKHIPEEEGFAPEWEGYQGSFQTNYDFEDPTAGSGWGLLNDSRWERIAAVDRYNGCCYLLLRPGGGLGGVFYNYYPPHGSSTVQNTKAYSEFTVRCQAVHNSGDCSVQFSILGIGTSGFTGEWRSDWKEVDAQQGGSWTRVRTQTPKDQFPLGTIGWQFRLISGVHQTIDVDYSQQYYGPN